MWLITVSAYHVTGLLSYGLCRIYSCHFSLSLPQEQHCPHVCHIFLKQARRGEDGRYVEGHADGCWLLLFISPRVVLAADWWEWWERGGEEVFKECLSGVEWLSYGVRWRLETSHTALLRLYEWWDWILHLGPHQGGVGGQKALHCNRSCLLWGEDLPASQRVLFRCILLCFYPLLCGLLSFLLLVWLFLPASSTPFPLTTSNVSSYPWISAVNITLPQLCCFLCSFSTNDTDSACGNVGTPKRKKRCWGVCVRNVCNFESLDIFFWLLHPLLLYFFRSLFIITDSSIPPCHLDCKGGSVRQRCHNISRAAKVALSQMEVHQMEP